MSYQARSPAAVVILFLLLSIAGTERVARRQFLYKKKAIVVTRVELVN